MARYYPKDAAKKGETQQAVPAWLVQQAPGSEFYYRDLADKLGHEYTTVSRVLVGMSRQSDPPVQNGHSKGRWRITGNPVFSASEPVPGPRMSPEVGSLAEVVGWLKDGGLLFRDAEGRVWKAEEL